MPDQYVPHLSLTWGGTFYGSEVWQMGLRFACPLLLTESARDSFCEAQLDDAAADLSSWWQRSASGASVHAVMEWAKFNAIGADGKYENKTTTHSKRLSPAVTPPGFPSVTTQHLPPQVALVLSLRTGNRGPREAWGHIYMPCGGIDFLFTGPYIKDEHVATIAGSFQELIDDLNNWDGIDPPDAPYVAIASKYSSYTDKRSGVLKTFEPAMTKVTDVWVGNLFDVHRSRANKLRQTYAKTGVA